MDSLKPLHCLECPVSREDQMCATVVIRSIRGIAKLGYDTSSDKRTGQAILISLSNNDTSVEQVVMEECVNRQNEELSMRRGYGTVVY